VAGFIKIDPSGHNRQCACHQALEMPVVRRVGGLQVPRLLPGGVLPQPKRSKVVFAWGQAQKQALQRAALDVAAGVRLCQPDRARP